MPKLQAGAFVTAYPSNLYWDYEYTDGVDELRDQRLSALDKKHLPWGGAGGPLELAYDERPWVAGEDAADVAWAVEKLAAVADGLD